MDQTSQTRKIFDDSAQLYQDKYMSVELYAESLDFFCSAIGENEPSILDVACGPGNLTRYILDRIKRAKLTGIDLAPAMLQLAQANNPIAEFIEMDCRQLEFKTNSFDAVVCGFALPYLSREETRDFIEQTRLIIKPGGYFYLSTMEGDHSQSGFEGPTTEEGGQLYMNYHEEKYLTEYLEEAGFQIIHTDRKLFEGEEFSSTDLIIVSRYVK